MSKETEAEERLGGKERIKNEEENSLEAILASIDESFEIIKLHIPTFSTK